MLHKHLHKHHDLLRNYTRAEMVSPLTVTGRMNCGIRWRTAKIYN